MGYLSEYEWVSNARNGGSTYASGYAWRLVLHTMEGWLWPSTPRNHAYPPHLWYSPRTRAKYQTVPLDRGAFALWQPSGGYYTNRARAIQVEIEGWSSEAPGWPEEWLTNLAVDVVMPVADWLAAQGVTLNLGNIEPAGAIPMSARDNAPQRMTWERWVSFDGICSHRHVPGNDHWDVGGLAVARIAQIAQELRSPLGSAVVPDVPPEPPKPKLWPIPILAA